MAAFITAIYDTKGNLLRAASGNPIWTKPTAQQVADMIARAADEGCTHTAGTVYVWTGDDIEPAEWIQDNPEPAAARAFGADQPPAPTYRWMYGENWSTTLSPA